MSTLWSNVRPAPLARAHAFCFPHAGGAASVFRDWPRHTGGELEIYAAELPGRATRQSEPPITDFDALTDAVVRAILPLLGRPFVLFGHSMGALAAFETAHRLQQLSLAPPVHLFVSGEPAPAVRASRRSPVTDDELLAELRHLGGTPDAVLRDDGLRRYFLPVLRADFQVLATYRYRLRLPLECPITAFGGRSDPELSAGDMEGWKAETRGDFRPRWLGGGHFLSPAEQQLVVEEMCVAVRGVPSLQLD